MSTFFVRATSMSVSVGSAGQVAAVTPPVLRGKSFGIAKCFAAHVPHSSKETQLRMDVNEVVHLQVRSTWFLARCHCAVPSAAGWRASSVQRPRLSARSDSDEWPMSGT